LLFIEQLFLILGLAMDGFAASVCMGLCLSERRTRRAAAVIAAVSGFHTLFFVFGYLLGCGCAGCIRHAAPCIAGIILLLLGLSVLLESRRQSPAPEVEALGTGRILTLSFATSIDAMSVGFSFAVLDAALFLPAAAVLCVMAALSALGLVLGQFLGLRFCRFARLGGGIILCLFGLKNLLL